MPFSDLGQHASGLYGSGSKWFNMNALVTEVFESYRYWGYFPFSSPKQFFPDLMSVNWHTVLSSHILCASNIGKLAHCLKFPHIACF